MDIIAPPTKLSFDDFDANSFYEKLVEAFAQSEEVKASISKIVKEALQNEEGDESTNDVTKVNGFTF